VKLAAFAWNHEGLGHVSRVCAIASAVRAASASTVETHVYVEEWQHLLMEYRLPQIPLPRYRGQLLDDEWWDAGEGTLEPAVGQAAAETVITSTLAEGTVVLHDVVVHRVLHDVALARGLRQVLVARARKDRPDVAKWVASCAPGISDVVIPSDAFSEAQKHGVRVLRVPPIRRQLIETRSIWDGGAKGGVRVAILTGGGGHPDAEDFLNAAAAAVEQFAGSLTLGTVDVQMILGPLFRGCLDLSASSARIRIRPYVDARYSPYTDTDMVICQAGYNTVAEIVAANVRAVIVPGKRALDDQVARARRLQRSHIAVVERATAGEIARAVIQVLAQPVETDGELMSDGAERVADLLLESAHGRGR
jgi:hypothetical protein